MASHDVEAHPRQGLDAEHAARPPRPRFLTVLRIIPSHDQDDSVLHSSTKCIVSVPVNPAVSSGRRNEASADAVFGTDTETRDWATFALVPMITDLTDGLSSTVICHGRESSLDCPTFTESSMTTLRFMTDRILYWLGDSGDGSSSLHLSVLEIYNEKLYDLATGTQVSLHDHPGKGKKHVLDLAGLSTTPVRTETDLALLLEEAASHLQGQMDDGYLSSHIRFRFSLVGDENSRTHPPPTIDVFELGRVRHVASGTTPSQSALSRMSPSRRPPTASPGWNNSPKVSRIRPAHRRSQGHVNSSLSLLRAQLERVSRGERVAPASWRMSRVLHLLREAFCDASGQTVVMGTIAQSRTAYHDNAAVLSLTRLIPRGVQKTVSHPSPRSVSAPSTPSRRKPKVPWRDVLTPKRRRPILEKNTPILSPSHALNISATPAEDSARNGVISINKHGVQPEPHNGIDQSVAARLGLDTQQQAVFLARIHDRLAQLNDAMSPSVPKRDKDTSLGIYSEPKDVPVRPIDFERPEPKVEPPQVQPVFEALDVHDNTSHSEIPQPQQEPKVRAPPSPDEVEMASPSHELLHMSQETQTSDPETPTYRLDRESEVSSPVTTDLNLSTRSVDLSKLESSPLQQVTVTTPLATSPEADSEQAGSPPCDGSAVDDLSQTESVIMHLSRDASPNVSHEDMSTADDQEQTDEEDSRDDEPDTVPDAVLSMEIAPPPQPVGVSPPNSDILPRAHRSKLSSIKRAQSTGAAQTATPKTDDNSSIEYSHKPLSVVVSSAADPVGLETQPVPVVETVLPAKFGMSASASVHRRSASTGSIGDSTLAAARPSVSMSQLEVPQTEFMREPESIGSVRTRSSVSGWSRPRPQPDGDESSYESDDGEEEGSMKPIAPTTSTSRDILVYLSLALAMFSVLSAILISVQEGYPGNDQHRRSGFERGTT